MKSFVAASLAALAVAHPLVEKRQSTNIDATVLQFALTLEHLENVFYEQAVKNFTAEDFKKAGLAPLYYDNLKYIAHDENTHVSFLSTALKAANVTPTAACTYKFPYTDVHSFLTLSSVLEGVGTSAYLGGAPLITSKAYLTAAGSILVDEALHTSLQRTAVGEVASANPFGTPLDPTSVYTLAASFIVSCPKSNPTLPFTPYPAASVKTTSKRHEPESYGHHAGSYGGWHGEGSAPAAPALPKQGDKLTLTAAKVPAGAFLTFVSGLDVVSVPATVSGKDATASIPEVTQGQSYVFITSSSSSGALDAKKIVAGPAIVEVAPQAPTIDYTIV